MKKIICIFGTRPEAIKMVPVIRELRKYPGRCKVTICVTAQHREMLDQVLSVFDLKPDIDLNLMRDNQSLEELTAGSIKALSKVIGKTNPDLVLVQGDTTTAMAAALAAFYQKIPIGHIEAGLRTDNIYNPFPEEVNRKIISILSAYNFAPTKKAWEALLKEDIDRGTIFFTGNTIVDALKAIISKKNGSGIKVLPPLSREKIILVTAHRRENFGKPLKNICQALKIIAQRNQDIEIVYPVHLNPNVRSAVYGILDNLSGVRLSAPLAYPEFIGLLNRCYLVLTDSGGIQEEASVLGKPVLVLRNETERPEGVAAKVAKLVGTDPQVIIENVERLLSKPREYKQMSKASDLYGDGRAAGKIVRIILGM
ncbi:MAG: UDP-N-acetylglucosamine 2-epimerase (non-hydrolyzing) [Candidatus Omnitrophota bacterium]|jgi:UDP-N-acetylglucosamine 2-epimerase (non-hydrolysing)